MNKSKKKIKAILLSAGFGKRLRPLTLNTPKCLVSIDGEPLIIKWLKKLEEIGCEEALINTHYLASKVEEVIKGWDQTRLKVKITYEEELLGTAGTLRNNLNFFKDSIGLLIHTDNVTSMHLKDFLNAHFSRDMNCILSMVTFLSKTPEHCGVVKTDKNGILIDYFEKVKNPPSKIANGAIFAFEESFINYFENLSNSHEDFCKEIVPLLKGKIQTYFTNCLFIDIGLPDSLILARELLNKSKNDC